MSKENSLYKTMEIKSLLLKRASDTLGKLWLYIKDNNYHKFEQMIDKHPNLIESVDKNENTLLNVAVQCNNKSIAQHLLELGAKVNTQNVYIN
jgi:hypothetical protein